MKGELPAGWEWKRLGDIAIVKDVDHKMPKEKDDGILFLSPKDFVGFDEIDFKNCKRISEEDYSNLSKKIKPEYGDILYSRIGTIGKVRLVPKDPFFQISYSLCIIRPKTELLKSHYLYWVLKSSLVRRQALEKQKSIAVPDLGLGQICSIKIPLPPLTVQRQIVAVLEQAEAVKRQRLEADALTGVLLQSVFLEMFGEFIRNQLKIHQIKLENLCKKIIDGNYGGSYPTPQDFIECGVPFLTSTVIDENGQIKKDSIKYISPVQHSKLIKAHTYPDDVILTNRGANVGAVSIIPYWLGECNIGPQLTKFSVKKEKLNPIFLKFLLSHELFQQELTNSNSGTAMNFISLTRTKNISIPLPPITLQQQFARIVEDVERIRERQVASGKEIEGLYEGLMQRAFSGELVA